MMSDSLTWPERGNFGYRPLVGPYLYEPRRLLEQRKFFGLQPEAALHYGTLRDNEGHFYSLTRRFAINKAAGNRDTLLVQSTRNDEGGLKFDRALFEGAATGAGCELGSEGDSAFRRSPKGAAGRAYSIVYAPRTLQWVEEGMMELEGHFCGPGLHWYLPQADAGIYYVSAMFQVAGSLAGRPVRGFIACDQTYMGEGAIQYGAGDPLAGDHTHITWYTWGTRYKDGSFEGGHFSAGHDKWGFALLTTDQEAVTATTNVEGLVRPGSDRNFPDGIVLRVEDALWEFLPDPRGRMPDLLGKSQPSTPQNEGRWRRVGDTREPDVHWAWGEINPAFGVSKRYRFRF
jgi:hypothetical protein